MRPSCRSRLVGVLAALTFTLALGAAGARATAVTPQNVPFQAGAVGNITLETLPAAHTIVCASHTLSDVIPFTLTNPGVTGPGNSIIADINGMSSSSTNLLSGCVIDRASSLSGGALAPWSFSWNVLNTPARAVRVGAVALPERGIELADPSCTITADVGSVQSMSGQWTNGGAAATLTFVRQGLIATSTTGCAYGTIQRLLFSGTYAVATTAPTGPVGVN